MKLTYISHATLLIEYHGKKIVTDPWVKGSAYCNQWHLFPKALHPEKIKDADFVFYSHGHEDHLHGESLKEINTKAILHYPYSWYGGTKDFFHELGFQNVKEVLNEKTLEFGEKMRVTYLSNNLDNVMVIELGDEVIININDALPSASSEMIAYFIKRIKAGWKKIDYLFSSYGGASYFPNTVRSANKKDKEIAETRELFFVNNFCKIVSALQPKFAIPFASDFVLLDDHQRWINSCKFPRNALKEFYKKQIIFEDKVEVIEAYPEDYFENSVFYKASPYHEQIKSKSLLDRVDEDYAEEIAGKRNTQFLDEAAFETILKRTKNHILRKQYIIPLAIRTKIKFAIRFTDAARRPVLQVDFRKGQTIFVRTEHFDKDIDLYIEIKSTTLAYSIDNEWGGDALIIGYAAEIFLRNPDAVKYEYENYCVRLLSRYPNTREYLKKTPFRALKYLLSDTIKRRNLIGKILHKNSNPLAYTESKLSDRELWLNKDKCEVCKACNL